MDESSVLGLLKTVSFAYKSHVYIQGFMGYSNRSRHVATKEFGAQSWKVFLRPKTKCFGA